MTDLRKRKRTPEEIERFRAQSIQRWKDPAFRERTLRAVIKAHGTKDIKGVMDRLLRNTGPKARAKGRFSHRSKAPVSLAPLSFMERTS